MLFFLALRFLTFRWRQSLLSVGSVAVGVAILITALSLTNGFEADLVDKILGTSPHLSVAPAFGTTFAGYEDVRKRVKALPGVAGATPAIGGQALVASGPETIGTLVQGIDPRAERQDGRWASYLRDGDLPANGSASIVLGSELGKRLNASIGDRVQIITGLAESYDFVVTGVFQAGLYELDSHIVFISLHQARRLYGLPKDAVHSLAVRVADPMAAGAIAVEIQRRYPLLMVRSWLDKNHSLLAAMALEKKVIFLVMSCIIIVALFGTANVLVMVVIEKTHEIGILRAIGATTGHVAAVFLLQGLGIGLLGTALGCAGGWLAATLLGRYPLNLPSDVYYIDKLPVRIEGQDFLYVCLVTLVVCLVATALPIRRAARLDPIEVIRHYQ